MATYSSALAWKILWTEEPGSLQSTGSQSQTRLSDYAFPPAFHLALLSFPPLLSLIVASGPINFPANRWGNSGNTVRLYS